MSVPVRPNVQRQLNHTNGGTRRLRGLAAHLIPRLGPPLDSPTVGVALAAAAATTKGHTPLSRPYGHYSDLLAAIEQRRGDRELRVLGHTPDGSPLVVVKCGGEKLPAVFISAGAHSPEQAGVTAAVDLIDEIKTEHAVYIFPCRDPIGLNGFAYALAMGMGTVLPPGEQPRSQAEVAALLRKQGEVIYDKDGRLVVLLGEYAYTVYNPPGFHGTSMIVAGDPALTRGPVHEALLGKRIYWPTNYGEPGSDLLTSKSPGDDFHRGFEHDASLALVEGAAPMERAYTQFGTPDDILHINRFHDTPWAPIEVRCARTVMAEVQPRLVIECVCNNTVPVVG